MNVTVYVAAVNGTVPFPRLATRAVAAGRPRGVTLAVNFTANMHIANHVLAALTYRGNQYCTSSGRTRCRLWSTTAAAWARRSSRRTRLWSPCCRSTTRPFSRRGGAGERGGGYPTLPYPTLPYPTLPSLSLSPVLTAPGGPGIFDWEVEQQVNYPICRSPCSTPTASTARSPCQSPPPGPVGGGVRVRCPSCTFSSGATGVYAPSVTFSDRLPVIIAAPTLSVPYPTLPPLGDVSYPTHPYPHPTIPSP
jgi:hypothetical protein